MPPDLNHQPHPLRHTCKGVKRVRSGWAAALATPPFFPPYLSFALVNAATVHSLHLCLLAHEQLLLFEESWQQSPNYLELWASGPWPERPSSKWPGQRLAWGGGRLLNGGHGRKRRRIAPAKVRPRLRRRRLRPTAASGGLDAFRVAAPAKDCAQLPWATDGAFGRCPKLGPPLSQTATFSASCCMSNNTAQAAQSCRLSKAPSRPGRTGA